MEKKLGEDCEKIQIQNVLPKPGLRGAAKYAGVWYRCVLGHYFSVQPVNYFSVFSSKYFVKDGESYLHCFQKFEKYSYLWQSIPEGTK